MKYLPSWLPFSAQRKSQFWRTQLLTTIETPYRMVREQMASGIAPPSYLSNLLQEEDTKEEKTLTAEEEFTAKWTAGSLYIAGADTVRYPSHPRPHPHSYISTFPSNYLKDGIDSISPPHIHPQHGPEPRHSGKSPSRTRHSLRPAHSPQTL